MTETARARVTQAMRLRFALELFLRARLLPLRLRRDLPFDEMLDLATPPAKMPYRGLSGEEISAAVHRAVRHPLMMRDRRCLREGVLCFRFLRAAGFDPRLHFGVDPGSLNASRLSAHCWVTLDGETLAGATAIPMVPLHVYPEGTPPQTARTTGTG